MRLSAGPLDKDRTVDHYVKQGTLESNLKIEPVLFPCYCWLASDTVRLPERFYLWSILAFSECSCSTMWPHPDHSSFVEGKQVN